MSSSQTLLSTASRGERFGLTGETALAVAVFSILAVTPLFASGYVVYVLPQYMLYGVLALSLGLLWGFVGIVSFGQAAFFALGAYIMGLTMQLALPVNPGYLGLLFAAGLCGALAALTGYFLFSAGVRASHFVLITLALSIIAEQIAVSQSWITGGFNGMFINRMPVSPLAGGAIPNDATVYFFILIIVAICYFGLRWLVQRRFGKILVGIRENEDRLVAMGFKVHLYKSAAFALPGVLAGLAGALYGTTANFVSPSLAGVLFSTQVVVWVAIGGRQSLLGAFVGSILVASLSNYLTAVIPLYWQLVLGLVFILVIIFFRNGLAGLASSVMRTIRGRGTRP
jgi:urea transport system permease protein